MDVMVLFDKILEAWLGLARLAFLLSGGSGYRIGMKSSFLWSGR